MHLPRCTVVAAFIAGVASSTTELRAQTTAAMTSPGQRLDVEAARRAFDRGVLLAQQGRWSEALEEFRRSRSLADRPRTAFNVALALDRLQRYREARAALESCLGMPGVTAESDLMVDAQRLLSQVRRSLATLTLAVAPGGAEVRINSAVIPGEGTLRTLDIDPGRQALEVTAPGMAAQSFELVARPGERLSRRVDLAVVPGRVAVNIDNPSAEVSIDDEVVGHGTTLWQGAPGLHRLRVEFEGYRPYRRAVMVTPGGELRFEVTMQRARSPWYASPVLWSVVGAAVVGGILAAVLIERTAAPDGGTTGQVFQGATVRW